MAMAKPKKKATSSESEKLAEKIAGKSYGETSTSKDECVTSSIYIPKALLEELQDIAYINKRYKKDDNSLSCIFMNALEIYMPELMKKYPELMKKSK
jgi:hypothetical protein